MKSLKRLMLVMVMLVWIPALFLEADETETFEGPDGVKITFQRPFKDPFVYGMMPVKVEALNPYSSTSRWFIGLRYVEGYSPEKSLKTSGELMVPPLQTRSKIFWMSMQGEKGEYSNNRFHFSAQGPDIRDETLGGHSGNSLSTRGIWKGSNANVWSFLKEIGDAGSEIELTLGKKTEKDDHEKNGDAIQIESRWLPPDWRSFSALSELWIHTVDWEGLAPEMKEAVNTWVRMGGVLYVATHEPRETQEHGLGLIRWETLSPEGKISFSQFNGEWLSKLKTPLFPLQFEVENSWFTEMSGEIPKFYIGIIIFVILFTVVNGPLNLYRFAPLNQRVRLFITVPVISFASVLLLIVIIYLHDGFGGTGKRNVLAYLDPAENRVGITQEQACRTGLLWKRDFTLPEESIIRTLYPKEKGVLDTDIKLLRQGENMAGDWFVSRSRMGHQIRASLPTRFRFESKGGETPRFVSSVQDRLEWCYWIDSRGGYWKTEKWEPGEEREFVKTTVEDFQKWAVTGSETDRSSDFFKAVLKRVFEKRNILIAKGGGSEGLPLPTLSVVQWNDDVVYYAQEVKP